PGPPGLPFLGNALQMPKSHEWITYSKWAKQYGALISCVIFGQTVIIINSLQAANEMLEKRASIYSDRP
ncbi:hypothetical protein M422DRAFT_95752, partial [Sphaerobolus stellatus SS14]